MTAAREGAATGRARRRAVSRRAPFALLALGLGLAGSVASARASDCGRVATRSIETLASPAPAGASFPRLAPGPRRGLVVLSWLEAHARRRHALRYSVLEDGRWSRPRTVVESESLFVNWADFPIVTGGEGMLVAAWLARVGTEPYAYHVRASVDTTGGGKWSPPVTVHADRSATEHGFVSVTWEGGACRLVWLDGRKFAGREHDSAGAEMTLRTALLGRDGVVRGEREIDDRTCDCCNTALAAIGGITLVAYRDRDGAEVRDVGLATIREGGEPDRAPLHLDGWTIPGCPVNGPALTTAGSGRSVGAAWYTEAGDRPRVLFAEAHPEAPLDFGPPRVVSDGRPLGRVGVSRAGRCGFAVSWLEARGDSADVMLRIAGAGGPLGEPVRIGTTSARRASGFPQILDGASARDDVLLAAWTEPGKKPRIRLARITLVPVE